MSYSSEVLFDSPLARWSFTGNGNDSIGTAHLSAPAGWTFSSTVPSEHIGGQSLYHDGSTAIGPAVPSANMPTSFWSSAYTFECWFKSPTVSHSGHFTRTGTANVHLLRLNSAGKAEFCAVYSSLLLQSASRYDNNVWHHLVVTKDSSRLCTMYIDKVSITSGTTSTAVPSGTLDFYVGGESGASESMLGHMDELAIYPSALSVARINAHYDASTSAIRGWGVAPT